ncbi:MAG: M48 family metalloprotease [Candidatus Omnitrophota bacterium]
MTTQRIRSAFLFVFVLFLISGCATLGLYNPATGQREFIIIPTDAEVAMGKNIHQEVTQQYKLSGSDKDLERVKEIGKKLADVSDRKDYNYHFFLIEKDELNAFTTPGGNIYFFRGLLEKLKTDDQIAAVLAHEIGHCAARHTIKKFQAALGYNLIGALIFSQVKMSDQSRQTASLASDIAMQLVTSAYSRKDEYQADLLGIKYMYLAGFRLNGMIETLEVLERESKGARTPLILNTHPFVSDRIKQAELGIKEAPGKYKLSQ